MTSGVMAMFSNLIRFWLLTATTLLLLGMSVAWAGDLEDGLAAYQAKDYAKALQLLSPTAEKGNPKAQVSLGYMYLHSLGVRKDHEEALKWFRLSAAQGLAAGQFQLGLMYQSGLWVQKDAAEALKLFRLGAAQGHVSSQNNVGLMYETGEGVKQDLDEAARWYLLTAKKGDEFAKGKLRIAVIKAAADRVRGEKPATVIGQDQGEKQKPIGTAPRLQAQVVPVVQPQRKLEDQPKPPPAQVQPAALPKPEKSAAQAVVHAQRRALVIGNDSYKQVAKLSNAREDARAIAASLEQVGYQVTLKLDLNEKEMKAALRTFKAQVEGGDEVLFFFAGHGIQLGAANYLLPTDLAGENGEQVKDEAIQLQRVLDDMSERKAKFTLAMIDACRDNPFKTAGGRAIGGRGLAPTTAATGQMVIFSAGAGQQAMDKLGPADKNKNGLFTRVFLKEMQKPGVSVDRVVRNVRNEVVGLAKSVGHEQVPAIYDQVVGEFYFRR